MTKRLVAFLRDMPVVPILVIVLIYFSLTTKGFFSPLGMQSILRDSSVLMVAAVGATMVFLIGGIDLTVGSMIACSGVASALVMRDTQNIFLGILVGVITGVIVGAVNGWFIGYWGLSPFIFTLAMLLVVRAMAFMIAAVSAGGGSAKAAIGGLPDTVSTFGRGVTLAIPNLFWVALTVTCIIGGVLRWTKFGRNLYLLGDSEVAARFTGMNVKNMKFKVYLIAAIVSSLAGVLLDFRLGSGSPAGGETFLLKVIAATVIGGTSLFGGLGGVGRTAVGAILIAAVGIGLDRAGFQFWDQFIVLGLVILIGATLSSRLSIAGRLLRT
jgi:ribose/xylose/arabinose/galactoside ABC-type transport system permease subunit